MPTVSLFTSIHYARPNSCTENALSKLSRYFHLCGFQAIVIRGDEVRLQKEKTSCIKIALKIASYILFLPFTLVLFAVNLALRFQHTFTIVPSPSNQKLCQTPAAVTPQNALITTSGQIPTLNSFPPIQASNQETIAALPQAEPVQITPSPAVNLAHVVEEVSQQIIAPSQVKESPCQPFTIKISGTVQPMISSLEERRQKVQDLSQEVLDAHFPLHLDILSISSEQDQAFYFLEELQAIIEVIATQNPTVFYLMPKKTEEVQGDLTIRHYNNQVIEEVHSSEDNKYQSWKGRRLYPNGVIETGSFEGFCWVDGTSVEGKVTTYRSPVLLLNSYTLDRYLMYQDKGDEKQLIIVRKKTQANAWDMDYIPADEKPIPLLAKLLEIHGKMKKDVLETLLSGPIDCEEFVNFLFENDTIFSFSPHSWQILLEIISDQGLADKIYQQYPKVIETLIDHYFYSDNKEILTALCAFDPTLVQRIKKVQVKFMRALLTKNEKKVSLLLTTIKEKNIALSSCELLFKKIAFDESEVTLAELQSLSQKEQEIAFQLANMYSRLHVVQILKGLGFGRKEELLMREGPSIFGCNMDALEMHECLRQRLMDWRSDNCLMTREEFEQLPRGKYIEEHWDIGSVIGKDYIETKAKELGLERIKVAKKIIVLEQEQLNFFVDKNFQFNAFPESVTIYREKVDKAEREIIDQHIVQEIDELCSIFEATGFTGKFISAENGIYIEETPCNDFWQQHQLAGGAYYNKLERMTQFIKSDDQSWPLIDKIREKSNLYLKQENKFEEQRAIRLQAEKVALQKSGCAQGLSFTFSVSELLKKTELMIIPKFSVHLGIHL